MDIGLELDERIVEIQSLSIKQRDKNGYIVVKCIGPYIIEGLPKVLVRFQHLSETKYLILNANTIVVV